MAAEDYMDFDYSDGFDERPSPVQRNRFAPIKGLPRHGDAWTDQDEKGLCNLADIRMPVAKLSKAVGRTQGAILSRLERLGYPVDPFNRTYGVRAVATQPNINLQGIKYVNIQHLIALLQKNYTTVEVTFEKGSTAQGYTYKVPNSLAEKLEKGDMLVVPARNTFNVAWVREVHDEPKINVKEPLALKWVVQKVDTTAYDDQTAREAEALAKIETAERRKAQEEALQTLLGSAEDRAAFLQLVSAQRRQSCRRPGRPPLRRTLGSRPGSARPSATPGTPGLGRRICPSPAPSRTSGLRSSSSSGTWPP